MNFAIVLTGIIVLAGCATAPSGLPPLPPTDLPPGFSGTEFAQKETSVESPVAWWEEFDQPALDAIVTEALARNADVGIAMARWQEARAMADASRSTRYPRLDLASSMTRARSSLEDPARNPAAPRSGNRWSAESMLAWEVDLFGRRDSEIRSQDWRSASRAALARAASLAVIAEVVDLSLEYAATQEQVRLAEASLAVAADLLRVAQAKARGGQVTQLDVGQAQAVVEQLTSRLAERRMSRSASLSSLAILVGLAPEDVAARLAPLKLPSDTLTPPRLSAPSELLLQRPDVQAAIADLRASSADLAAVAAERFPRIDIATTIGFIAASASGLGTGNALSATLAPTLRWRVLDFGELDARLEGRKAAEYAAALNFKASANRAFAEAQSAIWQLPQQSRQLVAARAEVQARQTVLDLQRARADAGLVDLAPVLEALLQLNASSASAIDARLMALKGRVQLNKALGRGIPSVPRVSSTMAITSTPVTAP